MTSLKTRAVDPYVKRFLRWLVPDQRLANRHATPPVNAYLGSARSSNQYGVGNISVAGFYMITDERWIPGTTFPVTLERTDTEGLDQTLTLHATVVRVGKDGVAFTFAQAVSEDKAGSDVRVPTRLDLSKLARFLKGLPLAKPESLEHVS